MLPVKTHGRVRPTKKETIPMIGSFLRTFELFHENLPQRRIALCQQLVHWY
jgi:hypothetical protein